ncbi:MAG TPA: copper resistance CopC family protein [Chloroflexota bacterium]
MPSPRGRGRRGCAVALLLALAFLLLPATAYAHANLERSSPAASTVVVEQPRQATLWFSEEPELRLTELRLLDPTGRELAQLSVRPVPGDARAVTAAVPQLQPGTYVVIWRTTSAVDGHTTGGAIPFTYGLGQVPQAVSVAGLTGADLATPSPLAVVARGLTYAGAAGLAGGLAFGPLVLWPALASLPVSLAAGTPGAAARRRPARTPPPGRCSSSASARSRCSWSAPPWPRSPRRPMRPASRPSRRSASHFSEPWSGRGSVRSSVPA